jgi:hypothetical protein
MFRNTIATFDAKKEQVKCEGFYCIKNESDNIVCLPKCEIVLFDFPDQSNFI